MASAREMRLRIRSVKNIAQVTQALQAVSASRVQRAIQTMHRSRPYATKAWQVLTHVAGQPGRASLHPLLAERETINNVLTVVISGDRGLAGPYYTNLLRFTLQTYKDYDMPVRYVAVGRKGRDLLHRRGKNIVADFSNLPAHPTFADVSAVGRLAVDEFLAGNVDAVELVYTDFVNMVRQNPVRKRLLPLEFETEGEMVMDIGGVTRQGPQAAYIYEPGEEELLDNIIPRFTALQVYHAVLESLASEHASRMVAMKNATDNATELAGALQLEYNKVRQQSITGEILDIVGGAEALGAR
jgi:F-type H+-transporting ATPase subunit gamma